MKYSHPLTVDEAAVAFPDVTFVIAHCGCPWFADAAEVACKNANVCIDLSGLVEGNPKPLMLLERQRGFFASAAYLAELSLAIMKKSCMAVTGRL